MKWARQIPKLVQDRSGQTMKCGRGDANRTRDVGRQVGRHEQINPGACRRVCRPAEVGCKEIRVAVHSPRSRRNTD
jgi:hypothetical protein